MPKLPMTSQWMSPTIWMRPLKRPVLVQCPFAATPPDPHVGKTEIGLRGKGQSVFAVLTSEADPSLRIAGITSTNRRPFL